MTLGKDNHRSETTQIHPRIPRGLALELKLQARKRKIPESGITEAALRIFLSQTEHEAVIDRRLNKLQKQLEKMTREQKILLETVATFVKVYLAHTPEIPDAQKSFSEEKGLVRFERFIRLISNAFENETLFMEAIDERIVKEKDFEKEVV